MRTQFDPGWELMKDKRQHSAGKGDSLRPVEYKKWSENYDRIFKKKSKKVKKNDSRISGHN